MSTNDFEQTTPLPVGDDETKPLPSFADSPIEEQKTTAEADTEADISTEAEAPDTSTAWTGAAAGKGRCPPLPRPRNTHLSRKTPQLFPPLTCGQPRT